MRKRRNSFLQQLLFLLLLIITVQSCRKTGADFSPPEAEPPKTNDIERAFFNRHTPMDSLGTAARQFVAGQNAQHHFAEKLHKQVGFPLWDKAFVPSAVTVLLRKGECRSISLLYARMKNSLQQS